MPGKVICATDPFNALVSAVNEWRGYIFSSAADKEVKGE